MLSKTTQVPGREPLRKVHRLTQSQLGKKLGVTGGTIGRYETGYRLPDPITLKAIADSRVSQVSRIRFHLLQLVPFVPIIPPEIPPMKKGSK